MRQLNLYTKNKQTHRHRRKKLMLPKGQKGKRVKLEVRIQTDTNYYMQNRLAMRMYYIAEEIIVNIL